MILLRTLAEMHGGKVFLHTFTSGELDSRVECCAPSFMMYSPETRFEVLMFLHAYPKSPPKQWLPRGDLMMFVLSGYGDRVALELLNNATPQLERNGQVNGLDVSASTAVLKTDTAQLTVLNPVLRVGSVSPIRGSNEGLSSIGKTLGRISIFAAQS